MNESENIKRLSRRMSNTTIYILIGTFITNLGNGMFTISISKMLYDRTGSFFAFGIVILLENILSFLMEFIAGYTADTKNPKQVVIVSDVIRGITIFVAGILIYLYQEPLYFLPIALIINNFISPFYKSANFKFISIAEHGRLKLIEVNSIHGAIYQAGQLVGIALAAPILYYLNPETAIIVNGVSFLVSAFMNSRAKLSFNIETKRFSRKIIFDVLNEWKLVFLKLLKARSQAIHIFGSSGDYLSISFINLMLVPLVTIRYNNIMYVSIFDASFAIGAMLSFIITNRYSRKYRLSESCWVGLLAQSLFFMLLAITNNRDMTVMIMLGFGIFNGMSIAIFKTSMQRRFNDTIKGKIASLKNFCVSVISLIIIPLASNIYDRSLNLGLVASAIILLVFTVISTYLSKTEYFQKFEW